MNAKLHVSESLHLPLDAVTQTFAILAKRGSGKSYTASVMAEEMLKAGQPIVALDPTGGWWGLRSGFPIAVLGGEHGDVPLQESAGEVIAQAIVENRFPAVIDLSLFRKGQMIRFMVGFLETLYRLNRDPVHLFVDEADAFAPQGRNFGGDENRMLGAMEDLVRRGRKRGIGCTLITQRPAVLNKNVLTQCESVFTLRMVHPRDIGALKEWIDVHAEPAQAKEMIDSLPSLPIGEAWFWSPGWIGTLQRVKIRKRETFDSSATPKAGETSKKPKSLAKLDLVQLGAQIEATVQSAKENDPRELKRRVAELEKQLRERPAEKAEPIEVPVITDEQIAAMKEVVGLIQQSHKEASQAWGAFSAVGEKWQKAIDHMTNRRAANEQPKILRPPPAASKVVSVHVESSGDVGPVSLGKCERAILTALAQYPQGRTMIQVAVLSGYSVTSGGFKNSLGKLRSAGYITRDHPIRITEDGLAALGEYEPLPTGEALRWHWLEELPKCEKTVLSVLFAVYPEGLLMGELAERTGYSRESGGFKNALGRLRTLELITRSHPIRASEEFFQ